MTTRREIRRHTAANCTAEPIDSPPPKPPTPGASGRKSGAKRKAESSTADAIAPTATTTADITAQITEVATRLSTIHISNVFELITATESSQTVSTSAVIQDLSSRDQDENREPVLNRRGRIVNYSCLTSVSSGNNTTAKIEHNDLRTHQVLNHRKTSQSDALKRVTAVTAHSKIASLNVTITKVEMN
ncbi:hypothetical protein B9Z55_026074 [Caenorhabditis nigoni]|uniref:Uncharacterized protein n=1 Tax=Caenorhabditis nigoni TaxID=1611254 RepID=A0A2G5T141_9PELO|nr:hypothetical protein B9Z55_026074 [Caenorhabditis nigoni]